MATLKVGIADYEEMKDRTRQIAAGEKKPVPGDPTVWFPSTESFARILSTGNRDLLRIIHEQAPESVEELAKISGRAQSNVSRTLKTMAGYGLIRMEKARGLKLTPKLAYDRIELVMPLTAAKAPHTVKGGQQ
ncbi:HVO_A0114 family putative DNA-binding protein [Shinella zoogloeoides]|uniref:MarR family transcriptional regulator n=1 Tax=Shinella zoogloeoides TaxID=352475 RepID=A0A6N8TIZ8_SHIZO|nr:MarR family transcriptional regulator [Shinella zoogloeoides]MXO02196.1 MarR family transcriptional regulator [Shinella zoogloeoides]UEX80365.1 MarR family transcriptional regulator [Shinella zoogloeoides]